MPDVSLKNLKHARIYEVNESGAEVGGISVDCMFNPAEYTVSKSNSYKEIANPKANTPNAEIEKVGPQTLKLSLMFDTYEANIDVSKKTRDLWKFMKPKPGKKGTPTSKNEPVQVAFEWGVFRFVAYITNLTQRFTLFTHEGVPVRAKVDVDFTQYTDFEDYKGTNPTSGGGPAEQAWKVIAGDRLDNIAAQVYRDATQWRRIAEHNHLTNPLAIRPGQVLRIPLD